MASTLILYAFFGDMLPRAVKHTGFTFDVIVEHLFLLNEGVYGIPIGVATSTLFGFIMFGAFLERSKMSSIFMDLACLLTRNSQGGPAKVASFRHRPCSGPSREAPPPTSTGPAPSPSRS